MQCDKIDYVLIVQAFDAMEDFSRAGAKAETKAITASIVTIRQFVRHTRSLDSIRIPLMIENIVSRALIKRLSGNALNWLRS